MSLNDEESSPTPEELELAALRSDSHKAWQTFVESNGGFLTNRARRLLGGSGLSAERLSSVAEDLVSDCIVATWEKVCQGRVRSGALRYATGVLRKGVARYFVRRPEVPLADRAISQSVFGPLRDRDEVKHLVPRLMRGLHLLREHCVLEAGRGVRWSFRQSPYLHLAVLDLSSAGVEELGQLGHHLGRDDPSQITRLREAAADRGVAIVSTEVGEEVRPEFFRDPAFSRLWEKADAGCLYPDDIRKTLTAEHGRDRDRYIRLHIEIVACPLCGGAEPIPGITSPSLLRRLSERIELERSRSLPD